MTWRDLAKAAGAKDDEQADLLLWSGSSFPFGGQKLVYEQIRHTVRHVVCCDDPMRMCGRTRRKKK